MSHRVGIPPAGKAPPRGPPSLSALGECAPWSLWGWRRLEPTSYILSLATTTDPPAVEWCLCAKLIHCGVQCYVINTMLQFNEKLINKYVVLFR